MSRLKVNALADPDAIRSALAAVQTRPKFILLRTVKGRGVSLLENRMDSHYLPLSAEQLDKAMEELDLP